MDGTKQIGSIERDDQPLVPQHVKRALVFMNGNMAEKITLTELACACAVPERTLLKQFQRFVGLPPLAYLRRLRLNRARSELIKPDSSDAISDIAICCGYSHLGRFAIEYRRLFGEAPSATRQRVRARATDRAVAANRGSSSGDNTRPSFASVAGRQKPSLLVLPLRTETLQERLEARDLAERLAATLSHMRVASVTLANPARAHSMIAPQPRNAGTQYCLLGRLTQRGERVRVIVRLIDVAADRHVWGDSFDGSANDPFELQDRVVDGVLCGVAANISDAEIARASSKDPKDADARDLALQALPLIFGANVPSARKAISILNRAIELDPASALPVALLASCQAQLAAYYGTVSPATMRDVAT
jgi:AraC-like DNA-binding protein/TolB-like protein